MWAAHGWCTASTPPSRVPPQACEVPREPGGSSRHRSRPSWSRGPACRISVTTVGPRQWWWWPSPLGGDSRVLGYLGPVSGPLPHSPQDRCTRVLCSVDGPKTPLSPGGGGGVRWGAPESRTPMCALLFAVRHRFPLGLPPRRGSPGRPKGLWSVRFPLSACFPGSSQRTELSWPSPASPQLHSGSPAPDSCQVWPFPARLREPARGPGCECAWGCRETRVQFDRVPGCEPPAGFRRNGGRSCHAGAPLS